MSKKKILMRLGKSPFESMSGFETMRRNTIGGNNGNLIFGYAAHKLLSATNIDVIPNRYRITAEMADEVNSNYDGFALPLANAFRNGFKAELERTTEFIKKLKIPFVMLSGGAQLPLDGNPESLKPIEGTVKRFATAVLDKSPKLSVRGYLTAEYLQSLGFRDVEVVGCPSMTLLKTGHQVKKFNLNLENMQVALNIQTTKPVAVDTLADIIDKYDVTYFPQDRDTLEMMLWGTSKFPGSDPRLPMRLNHKLFKEGKVEFEIDAISWIEKMKDFDFSIGPRIHGNIAGILSEVPSLVLAHDSRTYELAEFHNIPFKTVRESDTKLDFSDLISQVDYSDFNSNFEKVKQDFIKYISDCGFETIYDEAHKKALKDYENKVLNIELAAPVSASSFSQRAIDNIERTDAINTRIKVVERQNKTLRNRISKLEDIIENQTSPEQTIKENNFSRLLKKIKIKKANM